MHDFKKFPELTNSQLQEFYFESPHKQITENFTATVTKVHDGDTIRVKADFRNFDFPIRLANIAAAELNEEGGKEVQQWLEKRILNEEVEILINPKNRVGKWGRVIGEIFFEGMSINDESLREGKSTEFNSSEEKTLLSIEEVFINH